MIAIGSDHGGYELKEHIKKHLEERGIEYKDFGTYSEASVDYPDCAVPVCEAVVSDKAKSIFCNRYSGYCTEVLVVVMTNWLSAYVTMGFSEKAKLATFPSF